MASLVGDYIKYQRQKRHLSLAQLAKSTDLTPAYLSRLEHGTYQSLTITTLTKLATALEMSIVDLLYKAGIVEDKNPLPSLEYYLKEKYQLPSLAIDDVILFLEFVKKKYKAEIEDMKDAHKEYWKK